MMGCCDPCEDENNPELILISATSLEEAWAVTGGAPAGHAGVGVGCRSFVVDARKQPWDLPIYESLVAREPGKLRSKTFFWCCHFTS